MLGARRRMSSLCGERGPIGPPRCAASLIPPLKHIAKLFERRGVSGRAGYNRAAQGLPLLQGNVACKPMISAICHTTVPYRG